MALFSPTWRPKRLTGIIKIILEFSKCIGKYFPWEKSKNKAEEKQLVKVLHVPTVLMFMHEKETRGMGKCTFGLTKLLHKS